MHVPNPSIKDEKLYRAARISNAAAARGRASVGKSGGKSGSYQDWTVPELNKKAKQLGDLGLFEPDQRQAD